MGGVTVVSEGGVVVDGGRVVTVVYVTVYCGVAGRVAGDGMVVYDVSIACVCYQYGCRGWRE